MDTLHRIGIVTLLFALTWASGCATVVSGSHNEVTIASNPPKAQFVVQNQKGETVASGVTPAKVSLKRGNGLLRKAPSYVATIEKPGYRPARVRIDPSLNPWIAGNLVLGGPVGIVADSVTGAIWRHSPNNIKQSLVPYDDTYYGMSEPQGATQTAYVSD